jgi:hypothetical protein
VTGATLPRLTTVAIDAIRDGAEAADAGADAVVIAATAIMASINRELLVDYSRRGRNGALAPGFRPLFFATTS